MAEKIVSPGVFTKEIDQTFLPAAIGDIGAAIVGPTVKGPAMVPTIVNSYGEYQKLFGDVFTSGSNSYQYFTSHAAREYLRNGSPLTVVRILAGAFSQATASISTGSVAGARWDDSVPAATATVFTVETLADGYLQNSIVDPGIKTASSQELTPQLTASINANVGGSKDNIRLEISQVSGKKGTFTLLVRQGNDSIKRKQILETWNNLTLDPNEPNFISRVIGDQRQQYGTVITNAGHNFYEDIAEANWQGFNITAGQAANDQFLNAIKLIGNADEYDVNMIIAPGVIGGQFGSNIITQAIDTAEDRADAFVIFDSTTYGDPISTATTQAEARNSSYAATYYPWVQVTDADLGVDRWVPPSVVIPGVIAFNDKVAHPWFAPAGLNRGGIDTAVRAQRKLTNANRDTLYDSNVNPIATFPGQGISVFGQKTLQKKASALDRINVRRLLINVKKFIASTARFILFEQNNAATRARFLNIVNPFLEQVQSNSGLNAFRVVMDESNNTPDVVDRNILLGQLFLQPTRTAEFIVLDFTIQPTGASFPE
jgi:phage tail sheath protein FI